MCPDDAAQAEQGGTLQAGCLSGTRTPGQHEETHTLPTAGKQWRAQDLGEGGGASRLQPPESVRY